MKSRYKLGLILLIILSIVTYLVYSKQKDTQAEIVYTIEGQTADGFEDGTYCADVTYDNPNTGTSSDYTLEVEVQGNQVTQINWGNGGWLDEDHFYAGELDENGSCSFSSDKGYDYTVSLIGQNCGNLDSEGQYTKQNLPKYSFEECVAITGMTQEEIDECSSYSEGDILSENDLFLLKRDVENIRAYFNALRGYDQGIEEIQRDQNKMQNEIKNGYVQSIKRSTAYGNTNQIIVISKNGVNYTLEVRGSEKCTMGTAQFNENSYEWQMVYIKQYPNRDSYSGHYMRIIE